MLFLLDVICLFAAPAYPYKVTVQTAGGKLASLYLKGDEHMKFAITEDGYTLLSDSEGWWYAHRDASGHVTKSDFRLTAAEDETAELKQFKAECPKRIQPETSGQQIRKRKVQAMRQEKATGSHPITGERHALVILMQYKDVAFKKTKADFEALFNNIDYTEDGLTGSVRDFYRFASQGQLDYVSDVYGPYTAKYNMRHYGGNTVSSSDSNPLELCIEAIKSLPTDIDFSLYDNDGDGLVDNAHIIYAGYGEEAGASADAIWAHEYPHRIALAGEVGYSFAGYSCSPELKENRGSGITNIGVICHELGHALGAMDYYDTNYAIGGEYVGTGQWDIMASGSWNDNGRTPPNFNPYVRSAIFGWNEQKVLLPGQDITMPQMELDNPQASVIYRMETGSDGDYFLLENRQKHSFDAALPGAGLLIYHVHPNIGRLRQTNTVNATSTQGLYPICTSGSDHGKRKYGNINSAECPFPGSKSVRTFSSASSPAAIAWNGSAAKVAISRIALHTVDGSISFSTGEDDTDGLDIPDTPTETTLVLKESFEEKIPTQITVNTIKGNGSWRTYRKGDFVMNADLIPEATDGSRILMLFSYKDNIMTEAEAVSRKIEVEAGADYTLSLDICCIGTHEGDIPSFCLYTEDSYGEYAIYSLSQTTNGWSHVELPLTFAGEWFVYKLNAKVQTGGIFIDNIRLYCTEDATSVNDIVQSRSRKAQRYHIDGRQIVEHTLRRGINIVRTSDGRAIKVLAR